MLSGFQAVLVHGPRQGGKSTLVRNLFPSWTYLDLERPSDFAIIQSDLEGFLDRYPRRLVIDEAQRLPELFPALRHALDRSFEGRVIEELADQVTERLVRPGVFFWRTHAGAEVDLILQNGRKLLPIEVRAGAAVDPRDVAGLRQCMADLGLRKGMVITTSRERRSLGRSIEVVPWQDIASGQVDIVREF
jgi:predicted AAA+ superfamily ATPase